MACHPVLSTEARVALTLRLLGGLTTDEIARAFLVSEPTIAQRIVRAKRTLAETHVPFEVPRGADRAARLSVGARSHLPDLQRGLLGDGRRRLDAAGALRGRAAPRPHPRGARAAGTGGPRARRADGDPGVAARGRASVRMASRSCSSIRIARCGIGCSSAAASRRSSAPNASAAGRGPYTLQAAIAACHARASTPDETDWARIAALYATLAQLTPSPVVELNRAVALGMAFGPAGRPRRSSTRSSPSRRSSGITCCRACAAICSRSWAATPRRARSSSAPPRSRATAASASCCSTAPPACRPDPRSAARHVTPLASPSRTDILTAESSCWSARRRTRRILEGGRA